MDVAAHGHGLVLVVGMASPRARFCAATARAQTHTYVHIWSPRIMYTHLLQHIGYMQSLFTPTPTTASFLHPQSHTHNSVHLATYSIQLHTPHTLATVLPCSTTTMAGRRAALQLMAAASRPLTATAAAVGLPRTCSSLLPAVALAEVRPWWLVAGGQCVQAHQAAPGSPGAVNRCAGRLTSFTRTSFRAGRQLPFCSRCGKRRGTIGDEAGVEPGGAWGNCMVVL